MERDAALALLRSQHEFPGAYEFRVVVRLAAAGATLSAMVAGAGSRGVLEHVTERRSRFGNYVALHVRLRVEDAEVVLDVYDVLRGIEGVMTSL
jgi:putative lipoic acid-binding regulatory protein